MSAIEQVLSIGSIKAEHTRLYDQAVKEVSELAQLRADLAAAQRERDEARKQLETIKEIAYEELRRGNAGMWHQVEAEARHGLELGGTSATLTPRRCVTCAKEAAREMRKKAAILVADYAIDMLSTDGDELDAVIERDDQISAAIDALPLPSCDGCNPLKPEAENEATR